MENHYSSDDLKKLSYAELQNLCVEIKACENKKRIKTDILIRKILAHQKPSKKVVKSKKTTTKTSRKPKARKPKTRKPKTSRKLVSKSPVMSSSRGDPIKELSKLKVSELNAIIKKEGITLSKTRADGKPGNLLKADKVIAIYDFRSKKSTKKSITPKKAKKKAPVKKAKKKAPVKKAPVKKAPVKKAPVKKAKKKAPVKKATESKAQLGKLKVSELNAIIKKEGITLPKTRADGKPGNLLKADKVIAIYDSRSKKSTKKSITPKKVVYPCYVNGERKCKGKKRWCNTETGECSSTSARGSSYTYDTQTGLIGPKIEIQKYKKYLKSIGKLPLKPVRKPKSPVKSLVKKPKALKRKDTPKKQIRKRKLASKISKIKTARRAKGKDKMKLTEMTKAELREQCEEKHGVDFGCNKAKLTKADLIALIEGITEPPKRRARCDDLEDWVVCPDNAICNENGDCIEDNESNRSGKWALDVDDRDYDIVGTKDHIETLRELLGGTVKRHAEKSPVRKVSKKKMIKARKQLKKPVQESVDLDPEQAKIIKTFTECLEGIPK